MKKIHPFKPLPPASRRNPTANAEVKSSSMGRDLMKSMLSATLNFLVIAGITSLFVLAFELKGQKRHLTAVRSEMGHSLFILESALAMTPETEQGMTQLLGLFSEVLNGKTATWKPNQHVSLRELAAQADSYTRQWDDKNRLLLTNSVISMQIRVYAVAANAGAKPLHDRMEALKKEVAAFSSLYDQTSEDPYRYFLFKPFDYSGS